MDLNSKLAYLKGLSEGLSYDQSTKEGKMLHALVEVLEEIIESVDELRDENDEIYEYLEVLDEDLSNIETDFYDEFAEPITDIMEDNVENLEK